MCLDFVSKRYQSSFFLIFLWCLNCLLLRSAVLSFDIVSLSRKRPSSVVSFHCAEFWKGWREKSWKDRGEREPREGKKERERK